MCVRGGPLDASAKRCGLAPVRRGSEDRGMRGRCSWILAFTDKNLLLPFFFLCDRYWDGPPQYVPNYDKWVAHQDP